MGVFACAQLVAISCDKLYKWKYLYRQFLKPWIQNCPIPAARRLEHSACNRGVLDLSPMMVVLFANSYECCKSKCSHLITGAIAALTFTDKSVCNRIIQFLCKMDFYTHYTVWDFTVVRGSEWFKQCDIQIVNIDNIEDVRQWDIIVRFFFENILFNVWLEECKTVGKAVALLLSLFACLFLTQSLRVYNYDSWHVLHEMQTCSLQHRVALPTDFHI